jgi:hypothetical protein
MPPNSGIHFPTQTERAHVYPSFVDEVEASLLRSTLAYGLPTCRKSLVIRPDRILIFVVDDDDINFFADFAHGKSCCGQVVCRDKDNL